jgi:outer membrane receptor protein involved in Fe transport
VGSAVARDTRRHLFAGKLTWSLSPNQRIAGSVFGDPGKVAGPVFPIAGPRSTWEGVNEIGATDLVARYEGTFGRSLLVRALVGRHREENTIDGEGKRLVRTVDRTVVPNPVTGGFPRHEDKEFDRDVFRIDVTRFAGRHELRLGGDYELTNSTSAAWFGGGGQSISKLRQASTGVVYYRHAYYLNDLAPGYDRRNPATWQVAAPLTSEPRSKSYAAYLQDGWRVTPRLTLNLGLRYELQDVQNRFDETVLELDQSWAPRLGFVWDVSGNGRSKLFASYGRFFENIPQDVNIRAFGGETSCFCINLSPSPADIFPDPRAPAPSTFLGGSGEPVDAGLRGQHIDEVLGGFEYEVAPDVVLGTKLAYRSLGRAIEDMVVDPASGAYAIANPGEGTLGRTTYYFDGVGSARAPRAERRNLSFELTARKRFSHNWQLLASYVWSRLEGNHDGLYQNSTDSLAPNINSAFDAADFLINAKGPLSAERKHQLKLDGSYELTGGLKGLSLGLSAWFYSGLPLNAYGYSPDSIFWEYFLAPRGSLGRGPSEWEASVHLSYPIRLSGRARLTVVADVFNLFDRQAIAQLDERYNMPSDGDPCAGIPKGICGAHGGIGYVPNSIDPSGSIPDPRASATNPDYLEKGVAFTQPRSLRLGVRVTF